MKRLLLILILTFCFQSLTKADDIRDFEIEGMSIGDSLLDFYDVDKIKNLEKINYPNSDKFYGVWINSSSNKYDTYGFTLKKNDNKFKIYQLKGSIDMNFNKCMDLKKCLAMKKNISKEFDKIFNNLIIDDSTRSHEYDKTGKSKQYQRIYSFGNGDNRDNHIRIECDTWSKAIKDRDGFTEGLNVVAMTTEILDWIYSDYK